jgi:hypothetical protein
MTKPSGPTFTRHNWPQFQSALTWLRRAAGNMWRCGTHLTDDSHGGRRMDLRRMFVWALSSGNLYRAE